MLTPLEDLPDNVVGIEATGEVTTEDYKQTLLPAIERQREKYDKVRLLYVLGDQYDGYSGGALWEDEKLFDRHPFSWEKIAVATDATAIRGVIKMFGWMIPGAVKLFAADEVDEAKEWVTR
jgi:hypothetical protein